MRLRHSENVPDIRPSLVFFLLSVVLIQLLDAKPNKPVITHIMSNVLYLRVTV